VKTARVASVAPTTTRIETEYLGRNAIPGTSALTPRGLRVGARLTGVGREVIDDARKCPMCGGTTWILLDGVSTLMALEGGLEAIAYSCDDCGFIRWHRRDKVEP
jgi:hypothetical protein